MYRDGPVFGRFRSARSTGSAASLLVFTKVGGVGTRPYRVWFANRSGTCNGVSSGSLGQKWRNCLQNRRTRARHIAVEFPQQQQRLFPGR